MMQEDFASRVRANQEQLSANLAVSLTSLCAGPERPVPLLPEDSRRIQQSKVLLPEAGGSDELELVMLPKLQPMNLIANWYLTRRI